MNLRALIYASKDVPSIVRNISARPTGMSGNNFLDSGNGIRNGSAHSQKLGTGLKNYIREFSVAMPGNERERSVTNSPDRHIFVKIQANKSALLANIRLLDGEKTNKIQVFDNKKNYNNFEMEEI